MSPYIFSPSLFLFHRPFFPPPLSPLPTPRPSVVEKRARYLWLARYNFARAFCARSVEENRQLSLRSPPPYIHLLSHSLSLYSFLPFSSLCTYIYILYDLFYFLCLRFYRIPFVNANPVNMVSRKFLFLSFFLSYDDENLIGLNFERSKRRNEILGKGSKEDRNRSVLWIWMERWHIKRHLRGYWNRRARVHRGDLYLESRLYRCKRRYLCPLCRAIDNPAQRSVAWPSAVRVGVYTHINNASAISHVIDGVPLPAPHLPTSPPLSSP